MQFFQLLLNYCSSHRFVFLMQEIKLQFLFDQLEMYCDARTARIRSITKSNSPSDRSEADEDNTTKQLRKQNHYTASSILLSVKMGVKECKMRLDCHGTADVLYFYLVCLTEF